MTKTEFAKFTVYIFESNNLIYLWQKKKKKPRMNLEKNCEVQKEPRKVVISSSNADEISSLIGDQESQMPKFLLDW